MNGSLKRPVTKLRRINGDCCGVAGDWDIGQEILHWYERGAKPEDYPEFQKKENEFVGLLVVTKDKRVLKYERSPYPMDFTEAGVFAMGSGRDFAYGALECGADAIKAVWVASRYDAYCGFGVDVLVPGEGE